MFKKKSTFNFDEEAVKKGVEILKGIGELSYQFKEHIDRLKEEKKFREINLIGGLVIAIYSPIGEIGALVSSGQTTITTGLTHRLWQEMKQKECPVSFLDLILSKDN